jgi:AcrR family transcriptional regulator
MRNQETRRRGAPVVRKVLEVTLEQLAMVGFERLSVPKVATLAGVNKTSVYRRWPTKSELVRAALTLSMEHTLVAPETGDIRSELIGLARLAGDFIESPSGMGVLRMLFAESANPGVRELAASMFHQKEIEIPLKVINRSISRGELPKDINAELIMFTVAGALMHRVFVEQSSISDDYLQRLIDLVLFGAAGDRAQFD